MANPTTLIIGDPSSKADLFPLTTVTATGTGTAIPGIANFKSALIELIIGTVTGTSPSMIVRIQTLLPDSANWQDLAAFTAVTATTKKVMGLPYPTTGGVEFAQGAASLAAGTFKAIPFGSTWRVQYTITGTSPSFPLTVSAEFFK